MIIDVTDEQIRQIAQELAGTCRHLNAVLEEITGHDDFMALPKRQLVLLDEHVMECQCCGWWTDSDDLDEDSQCPDCQEKEE